MTLCRSRSRSRRVSGALAAAVFYTLSFAASADCQISGAGGREAIQAAPIFFGKEKDLSAAGERKIFKPAAVPAEAPFDREADSKIDLGPLRQSALLPLASTKPVRLEASYSEPLTLRDALELALQNNLPIKIASESARYQKYQLLSRLAGFLPSFSTSWGYTYTTVRPVPTTANSRLFRLTVRYPIYQGGAILYPALQQYYRLKAFRQSCRVTVNDALLDAYKKYSDLVLNNALLRIKIKSYQFSQAHLKLNNALYVSGTGKLYDVMQSRTRLAADEQALLLQQSLTRQASLALSLACNLPMSINFVPVEETVAESALVDDRLEITQLLKAMQEHRPELKQYEMLRLAACRNLQIAASALYPTVSFFTSFTHASTSVYPPGNGDQLGGVASAQVAGNQGVGTVSNTALNQTTSFSPTGNVSATSGTSSQSSVVASSGGNPIAATQSGGLVTSGAVAPSFNTNPITGAGGSNLSGAHTAGAGVFPGLTSTFQAGFALSWYLSNFFQGPLASIMSAKHLARQALLQSNQELLIVGDQVRFAYCTKVASRQQIESAAYAVRAAAEALRLATLKLRAGAGTNLELIQAQRDYVAALTAQAQAIVVSNQAQAQLLHDTGLISVETLTGGYKGADFPDTR